ncbi:D-aminoacyl-tRNA deacylase [Halobacterium zhouii]|uniref:D-aminoacyl-tRNA deacylase n=1 Tax=Halobacterium zhouii TaxID=2902624 RepID=UPI001E390339|nr:D-aminoacyl-tRNA deacylase [Halobacterium zhouii]
MIGIVASNADSASVHIAEHLLELGDFERVDQDTDPAATPQSEACYRSTDFELRTFEDLHLDLERVADSFSDVEFLVFVSRHAGDTGPLLTAHFTGNFGAAEHGGRDRDLALACPNAHRRVVAALADHAPEGYDVGIECTHHGPTDVGAPSMFVELGSGEDEWADPEGARAVASAVLDLAGVDARTDRTVVAFGGGHYAPRPTRILRETEWAVGHVAADWCLTDLGDPEQHRDVVDQMFTASDATRAVVDGEGRSPSANRTPSDDGEVPKLEAVVEDLGYDVVSETWVRETSGVPLPLADALETDLCSVDDGLRFGGPASDAAADADYVLVDLPETLVDAANAVDAADAVAAALGTALAAETEENGSRLGTRAAFVDDDAYQSFVGRTASLLERKYDVTREDDRLIAERTVLDPAAAADRGVPEGPAFGRLANGESVDVDGETVHPVDVSRTETVSVSVGVRERARERVRRPSDAEGKGN